MGAETDLPARLSGIEVCRGLAATLVVLYHCARHVDRAVGAPVLRSMLQFGHVGVDFFFVVSGAIILLVHYADLGIPARLRRYVSRRFTRLMPTYWAALALTLCTDLAGSHGAAALGNLPWSITLMPSNHELILGVAWTLRFEILFYAVFAVLIASRRAGLFLLAIWLSFVTATFTFSLNVHWLPDQFHSLYCLEFFFGMAVAYLLRNTRIPRPGAVLALGVTLLGAAAALENAGVLNGDGNIARIAYGIPSSLVIVGLVALERRTSFRLPRILETLGTASYAIYLFQFIFIGLAWQALQHGQLSQHLSSTELFILLSFCAMAGGVAASAWIEQPLIRLARSQSGDILLRLTSRPASARDRTH